MHGITPITPAELKERFRGGGELAPLDVREETPYSKRHLLHARCLPLSRLELLLADLVPRRSVPVVVMDAGPEDCGLAARAADRLAGLGYGDVAVLEGGVEAWAAAGHEVFSGINVPSKAFGEYVEQVYETPHLEAREVHRLIQSGANMVVLDSRPFEEFQRMSIPTGVDTPGAELAYRVHDMAPDPETLVVVNCAGRTRSIIGAQSLVNAGILNRIAALKDGTMGWHLEGLELEHGRDEVAPPPGPEGLAKAQAAARRVAERFGVTRIDRAQLAAWQAERGERTLFLLDVRGPDEFAAGHLPGARPAPGGQLVQATDEYIGVLGARVVLIDDNGVRATMTASWLIQMGWREVAVLEDGLSGTLETGPHVPEILGLADDGPDEVSPEQLRGLLDAGEAEVLDLGDSLSYRAGHIPGAAWTTRSRLDQTLPALGAKGTLVLTSGDGLLAFLAAPEAAEALPGTQVRVLAGGTAAWRAAGHALESGLTRALSATDDVWYKPYDTDDEIEQEMRDYLTWEIALVEQIERDGTAGFRRFD